MFSPIQLCVETFANASTPRVEFYSVVTDFAKFLGKSTSNPFLIAKW